MRFPEFNGEWKSITLGEICKLQTGSKDTQDKIQDGKYPFYVRSNTIEKIDSYSFDEEAILTSGDGAGVGKIYHLVNGKFDLHQRVYALTKFDTNFSIKFVYHFFSEKFYKRVMRLSAKNSVDSVRRDMIFKMKMPYPKIYEQNKISSFLTLLDDRINTQNKIIENLQVQLTNLSHKIFTQEIRFKSENESNFPEWKEKELKYFCSFYSGGTPKSTNKSYYLGDIPFIGSGNISDDSVDSFITDEALKSSSAKLVNEGDLLYALYGATSGEVAISKISGAINQAVLCIKTTQNKEYLFYLLKNSKNRIVQTFIQGGQGNLSTKIVKELKFSFPCLEEQTKIASFLSLIDEKLMNEMAVLKNLTDQKKYLLQQLFI